jgi:small Trp-rich protein
MYFLGLGLVFLALKCLGLSGVARWDWWLVLSPLALAVLWWSWADWSGYNKRKEVDKMEQRKKQRIRKNRDALNGAIKRPR